MSEIWYLLLLILAFISGGLLYRCGVADGSKLAKNREVRITNPIRAIDNAISEVKEIIEEKQEAKAFKEEAEQLRNVMNFKRQRQEGVK